MNFSNAMAALKRPGQQVTQVTSIPAPVGGINAKDSLRAMAPDDSIYSYNIVPTEYGLQTRRGTTEWTNGMAGIGKTIIPYKGIDSSLDATSKLFVAADDGIYDCTTRGIATATKVFPFVTVSELAGYGIHCHYVNDAGESFILYADQVNGLIEYEGATDTWTIPTLITFPAGDTTTITEMRFVMIHKQRLWMVAENSTTGYFLPVASKSGALTPFFFGAKFKSGGFLAGLWNFTHDGGDGVDDYLITVSTAGDVIAYKGEDPAQSATWAQTGTWYLGDMPNSRRIASPYGGDVFIVSSFGVVSLAMLFKGLDIATPGAQVTDKISRLIRNRMPAELGGTDPTPADLAGWELVMVPTDGSMLLKGPARPGLRDEYVQYVLNFAIQSWGIWRDIPMITTEVWEGFLYFTKADGSLWRMEGSSDNVVLDDPGANFKAINFSFLTSFQQYDAPAQFKIPAFARPTFVAAAPVSYSISVRFDYDTRELPVPGNAVLADGAIWGVDEFDTDGTGVWDIDKWGAEPSSFSQLNGIGGIGRAMAISMSGSTLEQTVLVELDLMWQNGGAL